MDWHDEALPNPACISFTLDATGDGTERWNRALVLINPTGCDLRFPLLHGEKWSIHVCGDQVDVVGGRSAKGGMNVPARSLAVLAM